MQLGMPCFMRTNSQIHKSDAPISITNCRLFLSSWLWWHRCAYDCHCQSTNRSHYPFDRFAYLLGRHRACVQWWRAKCDHLDKIGNWRDISSIYAVSSTTFDSISSPRSDRMCCRRPPASSCLVFRSRISIGHLCS